MKQKMTLPAYAKLNLTLDILRKREDGYHDLRMVMQSISLHDIVTVEETEGTECCCQSNLPFLSDGQDNIAVRAAEAFFRETGIPKRGLSITLEKHIPVSAGMAGGSTDGATVLQILRKFYAPELSQQELERIGLMVGSDVPFCLRGGTALAEGQGERLTDLPYLPDCEIVVCKPAFPISTAELFGCVQVRQLRLHPDTEGMIEALERQSLEKLCRRCYNVFEDVLPSKYREVLLIKQKLLDLSAQAALMTGSGPTVYGIFQDAKAAKYAYEQLLPLYPQTYLAKPVGKSSDML